MVDLEAQTVTGPDGSGHRFDVDAFSKHWDARLAQVRATIEGRSPKRASCRDRHKLLRRHDARSAKFGSRRPLFSPAPCTAAGLAGCGAATEPPETATPPVTLRPDSLCSTGRVSWAVNA
jgi:hypothetical protein